MTLERNYKREAAKARSVAGEWWMEEYTLFALHVHSDANGRWHWKINSISTWESAAAYDTKERAYSAALSVAQQKLRVDLLKIELGD